MKEHSVEHGAFWMSWAIDSRHSGKDESRNGPSSWPERLLPERAAIPGHQDGLVESRKSQ